MSGFDFERQSMLARIHTPDQPSQPMQALELANARRLAGAAVRRELRDGTLTLADALVDERSSCLLVDALLRAIPFVGPERASRMMTRAGIFRARRVGELTDRQRSVLVESWESLVARRAA